VRWAFDALGQSADQRIEMINIGGGGARADRWCQVRADVLGVPLRRSSVPAAAALGAAIIAGVGSGEFGALEPAVRQLVRFDKSFEPNPARRAYHDARHDHFRALYETMRPFNARFSEASQRG
jgi:xylulokinase